MRPVPEFNDAQLSEVRKIASGLNAPWIGDGYIRDGRLATKAIISPFDGAVISEVAMGDAATVSGAVQAARGALRAGWGRLPASERARLLRALAESIDSHRLELALLESLDVGKPIQHSYTDDVPTAVSVLRWCSSLAETAYDLSPSRRDGVVAQIVREPQGVVGIVLPWNYPLTTLALKIGPALAAGNAVVCKPADETPLGTLRIAELAIAVGFPAGVINVVPGTGPIAGRARGPHPDVAAINFTGSTVTGRQFLRYAADSNLKEISLECGGKNPAIILPELTSLAGVADELAAGFMMNSGQLCSSISRLLAPRRMESHVRDVLSACMGAWPIGDPFVVETRIGPLVSDAHAAKVNRAIETERTLNSDMSMSTANCNGASPRLVAPVVFYDVDEASLAWCEEIFGPVLSVRFYDRLDEAIRSANDTEYGLSAYVFGTDPRAIDDACGKLDAGFVSVNAFCEGDVTTPFGGFKTSGFGGKDKGIHSLDQYSRIKSTWWSVTLPAGGSEA